MYSDMIFQCLLHNGAGYDKLEKIQQIEVQLFIYIFGVLNEQFDWEGLPKEIKGYNVEKILNMYGQGVLFKVDESYAFCNAVNTNMLNIYGEPAEVQPVAINGMTFDIVVTVSGIVI